MTTLICRVCQQTKNQEDFYVSEYVRQDGTSVCIPCKDSAAVGNRNKWTQYWKTHEPDRTGNKRCTKCGQDKPKTEFATWRSTIDGLDKWCKECKYKSNAQGERQRVKRNQDKPPSTKPQKCTKCGVTKPASEYYRKATNVATGLQRQCKQCMNNREKHYRLMRPDLQYRRKLSSKCDCNTELYDLLLNEADGKCLICSQPFQVRPCLDHSHATNKPRGLLCRPCNQGLGCFKDNIETLQQAIKYLVERKDGYHP